MRIHEWLIIIWITCALCSFALADDERTICSHSNTPGVVRKLQELKDAYERANTPLNAYRIKGKFLPDGEKFAITLKDDKFRFDHEVRRADGTLFVNHRLDDGKYFFFLNHGALGISTLSDREQKRRDVISLIDQYTMLSIAGPNQTVGEFCGKLIHDLKAYGENFK